MKIPLTPLRCLHRAIDLYGSKQGSCAATKRFTYAAFGERCEKLASGTELGGSGAGRPGRIPQLQYAPAAGRVFRGATGPRYRDAAECASHARRTGRILQHSEPRILFYENDFAPLIEQLRQAWPAMRLSISIPSTKIF